MSKENMEPPSGLGRSSVRDPPLLIVEIWLWSDLGTIRIQVPDVLFFTGATIGTWTRDLFITNEVLYHWAMAASTREARPLYDLIGKFKFLLVLS